MGSLVATVPEVLADLSGTVGDNVRRELPDSELDRPARLEQRKGPSRCAWGFRGSHGEHRAGKLAGQSL